MQMLAIFPRYIVALCVMRCFSAVLSASEQDLQEVVKNIEQAVDPCPSNWMQSGDYCYLAVGSKKTWSQALDHCGSLGGELVKINSIEENEFVLNLAKAQAPEANQVWIGLILDSTKQGWTWSDNSVPVYTNWRPGEPNGDGQEECGEMYATNVHNVNGYWNDISCDAKNGIVCKRLP